MAKQKSLERIVFILALCVTFVAVTGTLTIVAISDVIAMRRELADSATAAAARVESSLRAGDATHALDGINGIAAAKLYAANGTLIAQTPPAPSLRRGLSTALASRFGASEIVCIAAAHGATFCTEPATAPLAIRIQWWLRVLSSGAIAALLLGWMSGALVRRALLQRVLPVVQVIDRSASERDYSQRVSAAPGIVGTLGTSVNALIAQMQSHDATVRRRSVELEAANKELEGFAYAVSHDLRAPLSSVDGFAQALRDDYGDRLDAAGAEYLGWILEGCRQMRELIEGMLEMARLSRADIAHADVDLSSIARSVADQLQQKAPDRQVKFEIGEGARTVGDPRLLRAVVENLMGNAFKFTRDRADARIEFGIVPNEGGPAFYVRDNGAGFDTSQAARMFRPFQRLHSNREFEGTGIGLATVQKIVMRHGGKAWAEGEVGKGATVYFTAGHSA